MHLKPHLSCVDQWTDQWWPVCPVVWCGSFIMVVDTYSVTMWCVMMCRRVSYIIMRQTEEGIINKFKKRKNRKIIQIMPILFMNPPIKIYPCTRITGTGLLGHSPTHTPTPTKPINLPWGYPCQSLVLNIGVEAIFFLHQSKNDAIVSTYDFEELNTNS
jgi:hypothetical protein